MLWNTGTADLNNEGTGEYYVDGENYIDVVSTINDKEGISQDLSSVIPSVRAAGGKAANSTFNNEQTVTLEIWGNANTGRTGSTRFEKPTGAVLIDEIDITSTEMTFYESSFTGDNMDAPTGEGALDCDR